MKKVFISVFVILAGCANPGVVQISPDTYMLSREAHGGIFASTSALKAGVIRDANVFATNQGKVAIPLSSRETPMGSGPAQWASFEYQFRVVDKNDPEVRRTSLMPRPDIVIDKTEKITADITNKDLSEKPKDAYVELMKLDDLRKKGIINDAEFESEKRKVLNSK